MFGGVVRYNQHPLGALGATGGISVVTLGLLPPPQPRVRQRAARPTLDDDARHAAAQPACARSTAMAQPRSAHGSSGRPAPRDRRQPRVQSAGIDGVLQRYSGGISPAVRPGGCPATPGCFRDVRDCVLRTDPSGGLQTTARHLQPDQVNPPKACTPSSRNTRTAWVLTWAKN